MTDSDYENCRECDASARDPKLYADISSASSTRRMHAVRHCGNAACPSYGVTWHCDHKRTVLTTSYAGWRRSPNCETCNWTKRACLH